MRIDIVINVPSYHLYYTYLYHILDKVLTMCAQALHSLHAVYIESAGSSGNGGGANSASVRAELTTALRWARALCRTLRTRRDAKEARALLLACKDWPECARRLLTMLNLQHRHTHLRDAALGQFALLLVPLPSFKNITPFKVNILLY